MKSWLCFCVLIYCIAVITEVSSLKCYLCVSDTDTTCQGGLQTCPATKQYCGKTWAIRDGKKSAARACMESTQGLRTGCTKRTDKKGNTVEMCYCTTDFCNSDTLT